MRTLIVLTIVLLVVTFFGCASVSEPVPTSGTEDLTVNSLLVFYSDDPYTKVTVASIDTGKVFVSTPSSRKACLYLSPGNYLLVELENEVVSHYTSARYGSWVGFNSRFSIPEVGKAYLLSLAADLERRSRMLDEIRTEFSIQDASEVELKSWSR